MHTKDEDCTVVDGECVVCGVVHPTEECESCGGHAFHVPTCPENGEPCSPSASRPR